MSWVKIDDTITRHPKFIALGHAGGWFWLTLLTWCAEYHTNGVVLARHLPGACRAYDMRLARKYLDKCLTVGLIDKIAGGWQIHDYKEYQPDSEARKRELSRLRSSRYRHARHTVPSRPVPSRTPGSSLKSKEDPGSGSSAAEDGHIQKRRQKRFQCGRFTVWEWEHDEAKERLGADDAWLDTCYRRLEARLRETGEAVINSRWEWLWPELARLWQDHICDAQIAKQQAADAEQAAKKAALLKEYQEAMSHVYKS